MRQISICRFWRRFCRWQGWRSLGRAWKKAWLASVRWKGWRILFGLPLYLLALLSGACALGLVWVFTQGLEMSLPGFCLYPVSAYCLVALCVRLPQAVRGGRQWIANHPKAAAFFSNSERKFTAKLYRGQFLNVLYGGYKLFWGLRFGSAWVGSDGIYNLAQAAVQLFQILRRKRAGSLEQQWRSYRACGVLILLMHLSLTGIVFQMINWNRAYEQGEILVITTAAFAFYKITTSFFRIARDRKHMHPVDSSVRMLNLAQAIFAIFSLQASMLHTFGAGESWEQVLNTVTGCGACLLVVSIGVYMIRRANREIKKLQENGYGE